MRVEGDLGAFLYKEAAELCGLLATGSDGALRAVPDVKAIEAVATAYRKTAQAHPDSIRKPAAAAANSVLTLLPIDLANHRGVTPEARTANALFAFRVLTVLCRLNAGRIPTDVQEQTVRMLTGAAFSSCDLVARLFIELYGGSRVAFRVVRLARRLVPA